MTAPLHHWYTNETGLSCESPESSNKPASIYNEILVEDISDTQLNSEHIVDSRSRF